MNENAWRWGRVVKYAEGTGQDGTPYKVMFGGGHFDNTKPGHPNQVIDGGNGMASAAAGAYQIMPFTWDEVAKALGWPEDAPMSKENQDKAFIYLAKRRGVDVTTAPFTRENVAKLAPEWASFPTLSGRSFYGQPVKGFTAMKAVFDDKYYRDNWARRASESQDHKFPGVDSGPPPPPRPDLLPKGSSFSMYF